MYPAIQIGYLFLPTLGVAIALGMIAAVAASIARARKCGIGRTAVLVAALAGLLAGVFIDKVANQPFLALFGWTVPSVAFAAGMAAAVLVVNACSLIAGARFSVLADCFAPPIALALAVDRFGCFLAGCAYGQPTDRPWGVVFNNPLALAWYRVPIGVRLHPTQLYECLLAVLLFCLLKLIERYKPENGVQILVLAAGYAFGRFFIEFLRGDADRGFLGPLSVPQWFCALALAASVILLTRRSLQNAVATR